MQYRVLTTRKSKNTAVEAMWDVWFDYLSKHYNLNIYMDKVMIQINDSRFESTLEDQIKRVWHFPYSDCDLVKFEDGNLGFVLSVIGEKDFFSFKFYQIPQHQSWKDNLVQAQRLLQSFISEVELKYDYNNDEFKTKVDTGLDRDTLSAIDNLNSDLKFYFG